MSSFVTRERVEQVPGFGQREWENQPVWLGDRKRRLGRGGSGLVIPQIQVRDASKQMRFNERERRHAVGMASRTSRSASTAAAGSPSAMEITARAL